MGLLQEIRAFQGRFSERAAAAVGRLRTENGRIVMDAQNMRLVSQIVGEMKSSFADPAFTRAIGEFVGGFDANADAVLKKLEAFGPVDPGIVRAVTDQFSTITSEAMLSGATFNEAVFNPMAQSLIFAITNRESLSNAITAVTDRAKEIGKATRTLSNGATVTMERTVTTVVANEVGAEFFLYQGRNIDTTRPFCKARAGKYWHRKEIEQWGRDAANGDGWAGMVEGTNAQTIFIHLGGWNGGEEVCRHALVPVARRDVPKEDLDRMREKGLID